MNSHTVTGHVTSVDTGANYHDIVHDTEATLACHPHSITTDQVTVGQNGGFVHVDTTTMMLSGDGHFLWLEEIPA